MSSESKGPVSSIWLGASWALPNGRVGACDELSSKWSALTDCKDGGESAAARESVGACSESIRGPEEEGGWRSTEGVGDCRRNCWQSDQTLWRQQGEEVNTGSIRA